nr:hypothetical protein [uncultured Sphingomonas sp.]
MTQPTQTDLARMALEKRQALRPPERPATEPSQPAFAAETPRPDYAPSGALDAEGHRPVLERSRKVR